MWRFKSQSDGDAPPLKRAYNEFLPVASALHCAVVVQNISRALSWRFDRLSRATRLHRGDIAIHAPEYMRLIVLLKVRTRVRISW
jgi:hypothetical protein